MSVLVMEAWSPVPSGAEEVVRVGLEGAGLWEGWECWEMDGAVRSLTKDGGAS